MKVFEELQEKLKGLEIADEKVTELIEFTKKELPKEWIPKDKFNEKVEELNTVNTKLEETNKTIEELKNSTENAEELKSKLSEVNSEFEKFKSEADSRVAKIKKQSIIKDRLVKENADLDTLDLLMYEFDNKYDDMKLENDKIIGLDDYIKPIKEKRNKLFLKESVNSQKPNDGDGATSNEDDMTPDEIIEKRLKERGVIK